MSFVREFSSSASGSIASKIAIAMIGAILGIVVFIAFVFIFTVAYIALAQARDNGQWGDQPANVRQWFRSLMQPDAPAVSCCGEADAYEADTFEVDGDHYVAIITDGKGVIPNGTRINVPNAKMKWDKGNPTGHGIIFLGVQAPPMSVYCYVAPGGV